MMSSETIAPVLIDGTWRPAREVGSFSATNPATGESLADVFPISAWADIDAALDAALSAHAEMRTMDPEGLAIFLRQYAEEIESQRDALCAVAALETGFPVSPRLRDVELPRTTNQLRQAADMVLDDAWRLPTIDAATNIRSVFESLGPVAVFGPNNFPFAYNSISGGDFASAIAVGCPVIAKAHPGYPATSRLLAECAKTAADATGMPAGIVQMVYGLAPVDGLTLVSDPRLGAVAFTGSRAAGLKLKAAADAVGKPIYLEMSSVNPVVLLPGALDEHFDTVVDELVTSALMGAGQFCTNPGLVFALRGETTDRLLKKIAERYDEAPCGTLLSENTQAALKHSIEVLETAGARVLSGGGPADREGFAWSNTLLQVNGGQFLGAPEVFQREAFGNATLVVVLDDADQWVDAITRCEGSLTGCIYSADDGSEDALYDQIAPALRLRVGRLLNDKMPTGVAVSPAMQHGGPFPASGHPHFTAVGFPASLRRFTMLASYDNVRAHRLPPVLQDPASRDASYA